MSVRTLSRGEPYDGGHAVQIYGDGCITGVHKGWGNDVGVRIVCDIPASFYIPEKGDEERNLGRIALEKPHITFRNTSVESRFVNFPHSMRSMRYLKQARYMHCIYSSFYSRLSAKAIHQPDPFVDGGTHMTDSSATPSSSMSLCA